MKKKLGVLIIEDSPSDAELNVRLLQTAGYDITWQRVETAEEMMKANNMLRWDLVLSDYSMPGFSAEEAIKIHLDHGRDIPFIVISGTIGEGKAVELIKAGVNNWVLKSNMVQFIPIVERELTAANNRRELISAQAALSATEMKYRSYIDHAPDGVFVTDETGKYIEVNEAACRITGYSKAELLNMSITDILPEEALIKGMGHFRKLVETGTSNTDLPFKHHDGTTRWWVLEAVKLSEIRYLGFAKDITLRKEMEENLRVHQVELEMQNDELVQANYQAETASDKYAQLYDFAPFAYFTLSEDKVIEELNHSGARLLESERSRLIHNNFNSFISVKTRPVFNRFFQNLFHRKSKQVCEVIIEIKGNGPKHVHIEGIGVTDSKQCLINVNDITQRVQSEVLLQQTRHNYETFFNTIDDFLFVIDQQGNIIHTNLTVNNRLGYQSDEIVGKSVLWIHPPERREEASRIIDDMLHGITGFCLIPLMTKSGVQIEVETRVTSGFWDGKPVIFGVSKDISKLKFSEEKFSKVFYLNPSACGLTDSGTGQYTEVNDAFSALLGFDKVEVIGKTPVELGIITKEGMENLLQQTHPGKNEYNLETTLKAKDGSNRHVALSAEKIHVHDKTYRFTVVHDLTQRKLAEEMLRESEMRFHTLTQSANDAIISSNSQGIIVGWNKGAETIFGYNEEEIIGKNLQLIMPRQFAQHHPESIERIRNGGQFHILNKTVELIGLHKNGNEFPIEISLSTWESSSGKFFTGIIRDITLREESKKVLADREATLAAAQRIAHLGSWKLDISTNTIKWSNELFNIFDVDPKTYDDNPESLINMIHPDDVWSFRKSISSNLTLGISPPLEYRIIHKDGSIHNIFAESSLEFDKDGKPIWNIGTVQDITIRKRNEEELLRANNFLDTIIQNIPDMIFIKEAKSLRFIQINRAGEELLGISKEELLGKNDYDFFPEDQAAGFIAKDREIIRSKFIGDVPEENILTKNKGIRTLHTHKVPLFNSAGEPEYLLGISEDITELRAADQARRLSEEKYKTMMNASPDGILLVDLNGTITEISEIGTELIGAISKDDLLGKNAFRFIPGQEKNTLRDLYQKTLNEGLAQNIELKVRRKNHTVFPAEISTTLIQDTNGKPISFMIVMRDISQRKKIETKQIHADRMANLGEMASGIAHEINQPLNIISLVMDKILYEAAKTETIDGSFLKNKSDKIFENIIRIRNIIDHVRAFSKPHDDYVLSAFDVNASIENAVSMINEQFKHLGITLTLQLEEDLPRIFGNTYKFEQVIINLLVNAKDAVIDKKSKLDEKDELVIGIRSYQVNQFLVVEVSDNGIGIGSDEFDNILLPFYTTKEEGKGTGLGLSICYQIIKGMHGNIEIESKVMNGTKIIIKLGLNQ
ncbi:MAG: PAS domain S-box protein [Bacteroidales bacterium]